MIDSHIHLSHKQYNQGFPYIDMYGETFQVIERGTRNSLIAEMKSRGINACIEPAIEVSSNALLLKLAEANKGFLFPAVGNHPSRCVRSGIKDFWRVKEFAQHKGIVAIGETGLDYHHKRSQQRRIKQKLWFLWQINLADKLGLPLILHIRSADEDALKILRRNRRKLHGGVCHCFCQGEDYARAYTKELGLCLGIGGSLLRDKRFNEPLVKAVAATPMEYLMLETDGPYVRPQRPEEYLGKRWDRARNTSLILPAVAARIAEIKGLPVNEVMRITEENTRRVFGLQDR